MNAVILAGGKGARLLPYTTAIPKPLVPIGDSPVIDILLKQLKHFGFEDITVSTGHLAAIVIAYLGDGKRYGLNICYVQESKPLGTVGPLNLIDDLPEDFLLMNGDVLTDLDMQKFFAWHREQDADVTIAAYKKKVSIDLGVIKSKNNRVTQYIEKPEEWFEVSMGVYGLRKSVINHIPKDTYFDFPTLIQDLLKAKRTVAIYPFDGLWLDIGRPSDFDEAQQIFSSSRKRFLPGEKS